MHHTFEESDSEHDSSYVEDTTFYLVDQEHDSAEETSVGEDQHSAGSSTVVVPKEVPIQSFEHETVLIPQSFDVATQYETKKGVTLIQDEVSTESIHVKEDEVESLVTTEKEEEEDTVRLNRPIQDTNANKVTQKRGLFQIILLILAMVLMCHYHVRTTTRYEDQIASLQAELKILQEVLDAEPDVEVDNCWFNAKASIGMCSKEQLDSLKEASNEVWDQFYSVMDWMKPPLSMEGEVSALNNPLSKSLIDILYPQYTTTTEEGGDGME